MAIPFLGTAGLFTRLGKLGLLAKQLRSYQNSQYTNMTDPVVGVVGQYVYESDLQAEMGSSYIGILDSSGTGIGGPIQSLANDTINRMVFRDNPQLGQTLTTGNVVTSFQEVVRQMKSQGVTVLSVPITVTPKNFVGNGNGVINVSTRRPSDGLVLENSFSETLLLTCTSDSYSGSATVGNEPFILTGAGSQNNPFAFNWPLGSNCRTRLSSINGDSYNSQGNVLTNSGFERFTSIANIPNNWTLELGTAGTTVFQETSSIFGGASALRILGDGTTNFRLTQKFGTSSGTTTSLSSLSQYCVCVFARRDGSAISSGVLTVDLVDGTGAPIADQLGNPNSFTIDLTSLSVTYGGFVGTFRTPQVLPSTVKIRLNLTTGLTNSRSVFLDKMSMGLMTQSYTSGPFVAVHSGANPFAINDYATASIVNGRGVGGTLSTFQTLLSRLIPQVRANELLLPSSTNPMVSDNLIG